MEHTTSRLGMGTILAHWTGRTDVRRKDDLHAFACLAQTSTGLPLRAGCLLLAPINGKMRQIETLASFGLPTAVRHGGTQQRDPLLLTADEQFGIHIARIHDLLLRFAPR